MLLFCGLIVSNAHIIDKLTISDCGEASKFQTLRGCQLYIHEGAFKFTTEAVDAGDTNCNVRKFRLLQLCSPSW